MTTHEVSILVIEDEPEIRKFLKAVFATHDYRAEFAENAKDGLKRITTHPPELVILDLGLPDMDGLEVIKAVRGWSAVPIIILSARGQEKDKVNALELGADDYLTKPFGIPELLARMKVALRHARQYAGSNGAVFEVGDISVDLDKRQVRLKGEEIHLTPTEYKLLCVLVKHAGKVVTQHQLLKEVWGKNSTENSHYLRIYAQHLRTKLHDDPMRPRYIVTEPGVGYRLKTE